MSFSVTRDSTVSPSPSHIKILEDETEVELSPTLPSPAECRSGRIGYSHTPRFRVVQYYNKLIEVKVRSVGRV